MAFLLAEASGFIVLFLYASFFEWALHRFLMHQPLWSYPFRSHALIHHRIFRSGRTYFLSDVKNRKKIRFAWWNAPLILALHVPLVLWMQHLFQMNIFFGGMAALGIYYFLYEYLHFCMHVPKARWLEKTAWFRWLDGHHHMHHKRHFNNLNVVFLWPTWSLEPRFRPEKGSPRKCDRRIFSEPSEPQSLPPPSRFLIAGHLQPGPGSSRPRLSIGRLMW